MEATGVGSSSVKLCRRCKGDEATLTIRLEPVCSKCYRLFITNKVAKRLEVLGRETRTTRAGRPSQRKYLLALSFGHSSSAMLDLLEQNVRYRLGKTHGDQLEVTVVHVDTDLTPPSTSAATGGGPTSQASQLLRLYLERYPRFKFQNVPLISVLELKTIDWSALPPLKAGAGPEEQLRDLLGGLPSTTSRVDLLRLFIRHMLISVAIRESCEAVLLGHSTTALAELTLAETAKGRGLSLPLQIGDGPVPVSVWPGTAESTGKGDAEAADEPAPPGQTRTSVPIYYPLRDVFRKELVAYARLTDPPLTEMIPEAAAAAAARGGKPGGGSGSAVVSHKDISIEEVMARYFEEVEENYPSVVANVVRTTSKLSQPGGEERCGVCGMALDETGDRRWRGEMGEDDGGGTVAASPGGRKLCYGCERSIHG